MVRRLALIVVAFTTFAACDELPLPHIVTGGNPTIECGAYDGPDCNDLLEIGLDAVAGVQQEQPLAIAVDRACPPNARCVPSSLGGDTAAFLVRWSDGSIEWATIPLPADRPASPPGAASVMTDPPPGQLLPLVGAGG